MIAGNIISGELPEEYIMMVYLIEICLCFYGIYTLYKLNFSSAYKGTSNNERLDKLIMSLLNIVISLLFIFVMLLVVN
jgi:hypothetical protein